MITCDQFVEMVERGPLKCTRAERNAGRLHVAACPFCWAFVSARLDRLKKAGADMKFLEHNAASLVRQDRLDPEFTT